MDEQKLAKCLYDRIVTHCFVNVNKFDRLCHMSGKFDKILSIRYLDVIVFGISCSTMYTWSKY